ncbi:MAG: hypothetical protein ACI85O_001360 [Saprospiraceae bacterium]|jgi:hypothetical protein
MFIICWLGIIGSIAFIAEFIFEDSENVKNIGSYIIKFITGILLFSALLHLIDFIFIGFFKKKKILAKIYYPFYRLYNLFSFSFLYRPVYYNFIDNKYGRNYVKVIIPYLIILLVLSGGINIGELKYIPDYGKGVNWIQSDYYDDTRIEENGESLSLSVSLPSMHIKENFLPVFLRYTDFPTKRALEEICPTFTGYERSEARLAAFEGFSASFGERQETMTGDEENNTHKIKADSALVCVAQIYEVQIDSIKYSNPDYLFHKHPDLEWRGIVTYLDIEEFSRGMHTLKVIQKTDYRDSAFVKRTFEIPFIKY